MKQNLRLLIVILLFFSENESASGQNEPGSTSSSEHVVDLREYVITGSIKPVYAEDVALPITMLSGNKLGMRQQASLGETLNWESGVNSTFYGRGSSRPIIRGFGGDRIRILKSGIDSLDLSSTSLDHAVGVETLLVERIEVVRGPSTLLYGSSAIGGVVNVIGKEIPKHLPAATFTGAVETRYLSVADEWTAVVSAEGATGNLGWHVGGVKRKGEDYEIPGRAALEEEYTSDGIVSNSALKTESGSVGFAWFGDKWSVGFAVSGYNTLYGVPGHEPENDGGEDEGQVRIDLDQARLDFNIEMIEPFPFLESLKVRIGYADYNHKELEGDEVGTIFAREGFEARLEAVHLNRGNFSGVFGLQVQDSYFVSKGDEVFIPENNTSNWALFILERLETEFISLELGARFENQRIAPVENGSAQIDKTAFSASTGLVLKPTQGYSMAFYLAYSERLPTSNELLAFGPHAGARAFEIGYSSLNTEEAIGLDLTLRKRNGFITGALSLFYNQFEEFIFLQKLSQDEAKEKFGPDFDSEGLPVFEYVGREAVFYGLEFETNLHFMEESDHTQRSLHLDLLFDFVQATNETDNNPLPRIPPMRLGSRLQFESERWQAGIEVRHVYEQDRLASGETATDDYTLLNASLWHHMPLGQSELQFFIIGTNLTNEMARNHVSFLKEQAPLPGRSVTLGLRWVF